MSNNSVLQSWVEQIPWKQQSILFSSLRGPDQDYLVNIKKVSRWMRAVSQNNADPSKPYMAIAAAELPALDKLDKELEHCTVHFVHHFADGLAVIAHHHPDVNVVEYAAALYFHIAEELFHFVPETRGTFLLRHRDKKGGTDPLNAKWDNVEKVAKDDWMEGVLYRFGKLPGTRMTYGWPADADLSYFLHRLWGKATGTPDYSKAEWKQFQLLIEQLEARAAHFEKDAMARAAITEHRILSEAADLKPSEAKASVAAAVQSFSEFPAAKASLNH
jgi:hypothetical protein